MSISEPTAPPSAASPAAQVRNGPFIEAAMAASALVATAEGAANRLLYRLWFEVEPARPAHPGVVAYYEGLKRAYRDPVLKSA